MDSKRLKNASGTFLMTLMLVSSLTSISEAKVRNTSCETGLGKTRNIGNEDPYFKICSTTIKELSEEEALEFQNSSADQVEFDILNKSFVKLNARNNPNIPPVPPLSTDDGSSNIVAVDSVSSAPVSASGFFDGVIMVVDKLIAIGQKIIPTIEKGKSIVTHNPMAAISVLPRLDTKDYVVHDMGNWSIPVTKHYKIGYKNGLGSEVISFVYSVTFQHSGTYQGKGKYLTGIRASARNIVVAWGFDLDATSQLIQISNVGSPQNVVAGATIEITYTVKNWTKFISTSKSFFISGDGRLYKLD